MATRFGLALIVAAVVALTLAYSVALVTGTAPSFAAFALAFGSGASMTGMFVLGAANRGRLAPLLVATFAVVFVIVTGAFWIALAMPADEGVGGALLLGLPRRTAIVLYGVGLLPMFLLPLVYAARFDTDILSADHQRQVDEARAAGPGGGQP